MKNKFRVAVTAANSVHRKGFSLMLNSMGHTVTEITGADLFRMDAAAPPQLIFIFTTLRHPAEPGTIASVIENYPAVPVVVVTLEEKIADVIAWIKSGVRGCVQVSIEPGELNKALELMVLNGDHYFDLTAERLIYSKYKDISNPKKIQAALHFSPALKAVLNALCTGHSYDEIALNLQLAPRTLQVHREALSEQLLLKSRVGLVLFAVKNELYSKDALPQ